MKSFENPKELIAATQKQSSVLRKEQQSSWNTLAGAYMKIKNIAFAGRNEVTDLKNK